MRSNPMPSWDWLQALADDGLMVAPLPEESPMVPWVNQLPQPRAYVPGLVLDPPAEGRQLRHVPEDIGFLPPRQAWSDIPDWLQALSEDAQYMRDRVLQNPYDGWGGGGMQARRRGLR